MENRENNVTENNVKESGKGGIIAIIIIVLILGIAIGVGGGYFLSTKLNEKSPENTVENKVENKIENNGDYAMNKEQLTQDKDTNAINKDNTSTNKDKDNTSNTTEKIDTKYVEEYKKIISKLENEYPNGDLTCDLIYFNNDNIPDLVIGNLGYWVSVYIYENGTVYNPVEEWPYGAMGNAGYDYQEKTGKILNYNSDYAGAIMTKTIYKLNSKKDFDELSVTDSGVDIDEKEANYAEVMKYLNEVKGYYYNGKKIDEQEYNNKLKEFSIDANSKSFKTLVGDKTVEEIKAILNK